MTERIPVDVEETDVENDSGIEIPGLRLTCSRCGYSVEVFGTDAVSARRGAVMLREGCLLGGYNFYVVD